MGDFAMLDDMPSIYRQCRATEDPDMSPFEFVTQHLLSISGPFDQHHNEHHPKPHTPLQSHHRVHYPLTYPPLYALSVTPPQTESTRPPLEAARLYRSDFCTSIFHPPSV